MITSKEIKIENIGEFSSEYVNSQLSQLGFDVLRWAITNVDDDFYTVNIAIVE